MVSLGKIVGIILGLIFFIFLVLSMNWGALGQTVNSIEYPIAFVELTKGGAEYGKTIDFNPPDGVSKIISAVITVQGDFDSDNIVYVTLNRQPCEPPVWKVSASASGTAVGYKMTFDCSNVLVGETTGLHDIKFSMDFPAKNVNVVYQITYYNAPSVTLEDIDKKIDAIGNNQSILENINNIVSKPEIVMSIHGTEYTANDVNGKVFLQLLNNSQEPILNTSCYIKIFYPNTTTFVSTTLMSNISEGLHYYDFSVPNTLGVYMTSAFCYIPNPVSVIATDDFECDNFNCGTGWTSNWSIIGSVEILSTATPFQGNWHMRLNGGATKAHAERTINANLTGCQTSYLTFYAKASGLEVGDYCYYKIYNGTQNITLLEIINPNDDNIYRYYSFEICQYNITGSPKIIINDTGLQADDRCFIDVVNFDISGIINTTQYQKIMGSGEVHVSNITANLANQTGLIQGIWNYTSRTLTDYNQSGLFSYLMGINSSIMNKLYGIQDDLLSINQTVISANESTQQLILSVNQSLNNEIQTLINQLAIDLANLTNITMNISIDVQQAAYAVWELFFVRGTPPLAPSTTYICSLNDTHILYKIISYNYTGGIAQGEYTKTEDVYCDYGCDTVNNNCALSPFWRYAIIIAFTAVIIIVLFLLFRRRR